MLFGMTLAEGQAVRSFFIEASFAKILVRVEGGV